MSHACQRLETWNCFKTLRFCILLTGCTIPCARHAKRHLNVQKCSVPVSCHFFPTFDLEMCFTPQPRALFRHLNFQKWSDRKWCALYILNWKCASRRNAVHFFDMSTSKSGPRLKCLVHFDLEMYLAPQWRALFRRLNFQKCSEPGMSCTFWLWNVLRATTACNF